MLYYCPKEPKIRVYRDPGHPKNSESKQGWAEVKTKKKGVDQWVRMNRVTNCHFGSVGTNHEAVSGPRTLRNFGTMGDFCLLRRGGFAACRRRRRQGWSDYLNQLITSSSAPHPLLVSTFITKRSVVWLCPTKQRAPMTPKRLRSCREDVRNDCHSVPYVSKLPRTNTSSQWGQRTLQVACDHPSLGALSSVFASILPREEHSTTDGLLAVETWFIADSLSPELRTETIVMGGQDWACFNGRAERMPSFCYPLLDVKRRYSKSIFVACIDRGKYHQ